MNTKNEDGWSSVLSKGATKFPKKMSVTSLVL